MFLFHITSVCLTKVEGHVTQECGGLKKNFPLRLTCLCLRNTAVIVLNKSVSFEEWVLGDRVVILLFYISKILNSRWRQSLLSSQKSAILTTVGVLEQPLGNARLHVARLVAALLQTSDPSICQELCNLSTIDALLVFICFITYLLT